VVYAAVFEKPGLIAGWTDPEQMAVNDRMLRNVIRALEVAGAPLEHVSILQGTKAYGVHVTTMRIPAKERQPRVEHPNFYWLQEDFITEAAAERGFTYTIWRPQFIFGGPIGVVMNLVPVIGAYAAIRDHRGEPFSFPGGASFVAEAADAVEPEALAVDEEEDEKSAAPVAPATSPAPSAPSASWTAARAASRSTHASGGTRSWYAPTACSIDAVSGSADRSLLTSARSAVAHDPGGSPSHRRSARPSAGVAWSRSSTRIANSVRP